MKFEGKPLSVVYDELATLPSQTYVDIGPGLSIKVKNNGVPVMRIHYDAIPERNQVLHPEWKAAEQGKYTKSGWDREQEINDQAGGGDKLFASILSVFDKQIIIRDPYWAPEPWWRVVGGFDHGKTNATCLLKAYVDEHGNIYMCGEFYQMKTDAWANNIWQNVPIIQRMPDLDRMEWIRADPSIFFDKEAQLDGSFTNINAVYRKQGFRRLTTFPTAQSREDLTFEERLNDHWANLGEPRIIDGEVVSGGRKPSLYIVCRNESERRQPGLHPYDCPNFLWEMKRMRRAELTSRQLLTRNPTEKIVDRDNHSFDAAKYLCLSLPKPAAVPLEHQIQDLIAGKNFPHPTGPLNPMSAAVAVTRFLGMQGGGQQAAAPIDLRARRRMGR
jgi:hypothetical protein